jgi:adenylate cyclase
MYHHYECAPTPLALENTLQALERAVKKDPEYAPAWAALADMYVDNHRLGISKINKSLNEALKFARKGAELEPENQFVRSKLAWLYFQRNDKERFFVEAERGLALNPNAATYIGFFGWAMILLGEWDRGMAFLEKGIKRNPNHPRWFHAGLYLNYFRLKQYIKAYQEALKYDAPSVFWDPLLRAAALGQMGKEKQAKAAADELIALQPDFPTKGRWLISCDVKVDDLVGQLIEGVRKAGITCD